MILVAILGWSLKLFLHIRKGAMWEKLNSIIWWIISKAWRRFIVCLINAFFLVDFYNIFLCRSVTMIMIEFLMIKNWMISRWLFIFYFHLKRSSLLIHRQYKYEENTTEEVKKEKVLDLMRVARNLITNVRQKQLMFFSHLISEGLGGFIGKRMEERYQKDG